MYRNTRNTFESIKASVSDMMEGMERYNTDNIKRLEEYVDLQAEQNEYDLDANLSLLKLYQFSPQRFNLRVVEIILLKALTKLPHSDLNLSKSLLSANILDNVISINHILYLADLLETCRFKEFWEKLQHPEIQSPHRSIAGFNDSIRKFVCHVVGITYQRIQEETLCQLLGLVDKKGAVDENSVNHWISKNGWKPATADSAYVLISSSMEDSIKTKKITEKIDLESVAGIMASCI